MAAGEKTKLHIVRPDPEAEQRIDREHRKKRVLRLLIVVIIVAAVIVVFFVQRHFRSYDSYHVYALEERYDTETTRFTTFAGKLVRYSTDGATCTDTDNDAVWVVSYDMGSPSAVVCDSYLLIADISGKTLTVVDTEGETYEITTNLPILRADIAENGRVAVLTTEGDICYLSVYDSEGNEVAGGEFHDGSGGYPMDIALSDDGDCLAMAALTIDSGESSSVISFYDFSGESQDEDSSAESESGGTQESSYTYEGTVIPDIEFISSDSLLAYGDDRVILFDDTTGGQEPTVIEPDSQIKAVFSSDSYFGLLTRSGGEGSGNAVRLYKTDGTEAKTISTGAQYSGAQFLDSGEICLTNGSVCAIYTVNGHCKYYGKSDSDFYEVVSTGFFRRYQFARQGTTELVGLRGLHFSAD